MDFKLIDMNTKTKKTLLISSIIILLVVNISALSTILYNNKTRSNKLEEINKIQEEMRQQGMRKYFQDELNLDASQIEKFHSNFANYSEESRDIAYKLREKRHEMMIELANINPNQNKLDDIAKEIGSLHYELKKLTINHFIALKEICNEEQQINLQKMFIHMLSNQDGENTKGRHRRRNDSSPARPRHSRYNNN